MKGARLSLALALLLSLAPAPVEAFQAKGLASWYGPGFQGRRTACGQVFNQWALTAAHRRLPCGTRLEVRLRGRSVRVVVNDRGPFVKGRILDLSHAAARALGLSGVSMVEIKVLH